MKTHPPLVDFMDMSKLYKPCLPDVAYEIPLYMYLDHWFTRRRVLNVFPYKSLRKMKHPLGPKYTNNVPRMLYVKYQSSLNAVHEKKIF